jgi:SAM-dependent methyltransferase
MHQSSMRAMSEFVSTHLAPRAGTSLRILDVGSMNVNGSYRELMSDPNWHYTGLDAAAGPGVDIVLPSPYDWSPLTTNSFDVVVSGQAFEHIEYPWVTILEINRVLKPGGVVCLIAPSGGHEHRYPVDCWRYYPDGMAALARWADLDVVSSETNWSPQGPFDDDSADWKDTVLVARKRDAPGPRTVKTRLKLALIRRVSMFQATRRQSIAELGRDEDRVPA